MRLVINKDAVLSPANAAGCSGYITNLLHLPGALPLCAAGFAPFSIRYLLQSDLLEQLPKLQVISTAASKEAALDKALSKMQADWQGVEFRVVEYKDTGTYVVGGTDEVQVGPWIRYATPGPWCAHCLSNIVQKACGA